MRFIHCFAISACLILSCQSQTTKPFTSSPVADCKVLLDKNPGIQLLDVRSPSEYSEQHLPNALNINVNDPGFAAKVSSLDKTKPVVVYCLSGGRSKTAAKRLAEMGYTDVVEMDGGIMKWNAAGYADVSGVWKGMSMNDYNKLTASADKVLISFYADWCAPCKKMAPFLTSMQKELQGSVRIVRLNADENKSLTAALKVDGLPGLKMYVKGANTWTTTGYISEDGLRAKL